MATPLGPSIPLRDYITTYAADRKVKQSTLYQYLLAAASLERWHGKAVCCDELSGDLVNGWLTALSESNLSPATILNRRCQLLVIWSAAHAEGLAAAPGNIQAAGNREGKGRRTGRRMPVSVPLDPNSLRHFYETQVIPERLSDRPRLHRLYRSGLTKFEQFLKRQAVLADLTEANYSAYLEWLAGPEKGKPTKAHVEGLRIIWRYAGDIGMVDSRMPDGRGLHRGGKLRTHGETWRAAAAASRDKAKPETVQQFYLDIYEPLRLAGRSDSTKRQYQINVSHFDNFLGRPALLTDLQDDVLTRLLRWLVDNGRTAATANKCRAHLLALWRLAARKRFVEQDPEVRALNEPQRIPRAWLEAELDRLWAACANTPGRVCGVPAAAWWTALHHVLWFSGERVGALLQLRWEDFDASTGWLMIPAEFRKFGLSDKATELPPVAVEAIEAIRKPDRGLIFAWDRRRDLIWRRYRQILQRAGLPTDRRSKFHRMRKSAASHYQALGGSAQALCGHSSAKVTAAYIDPRIAKPPQAAALLFTPGQKKGGVV